MPGQEFALMKPVDGVRTIFGAAEGVVATDGEIVHKAFGRNYRVTVTNGGWLVAFHHPDVPFISVLKDGMLDIIVSLIDLVKAGTQRIPTIRSIFDLSEYRWGEDATSDLLLPVSAS